MEKELICGKGADGLSWLKLSIFKYSRDQLLSVSLESKIDQVLRELKLIRERLEALERALGEELSEEERAELRSRIRDYRERRAEEFIPLPSDNSSPKALSRASSLSLISLSSWRTWSILDSRLTERS